MRRVIGSVGHNVQISSIGMALRSGALPIDVRRTTLWPINK